MFSIQTIYLPIKKTENILYISILFVSSNKIHIKMTEENLDLQLRMKLLCCIVNLKAIIFHCILSFTFQSYLFRFTRMITAIW